MAIRKTAFESGEFYHIYNRGVDKRIIFVDEKDVERFFKSMSEFNVMEPIGSIYEKTFTDKQFGGSASKSASNDEKLVHFVAYCLNPNHFHFLIEQIADKGIEKFMHRLGTGYTRFFNDKHKRSGSLFQGRFKAENLDSNEYLLHLSAYINLNDRVHQLGGKASKLVKSKSSWREYLGETDIAFCNKDIILDQFRSLKEYKEFAEDALAITLDGRADMDDMGKLQLE